MPQRPNTSYHKNNILSNYTKYQIVILSNGRIKLLLRIIIRNKKKSIGFQVGLPLSFLLRIIYIIRSGFDNIQQCATIDASEIHADMQNSMVGANSTTFHHFSLFIIYSGVKAHKVRKRQYVVLANKE